MKPPLDQIRIAFCRDDAAAVGQLLSQHPELKPLINEPIGPFDSPAITGVRSREMLDVLLEAGADINARSRWWAGGFGLLDSASPEVAHYALERGATLTIHAAARLGMLDGLKKFLRDDANLVHVRGGDGQTPLHFASTVEIAACLLDHGADMNARDIDHESTPAQYMVRDRQPVARCLVERGCQTDLLMACALGDLPLVKKYLDADPRCIRMSVTDEYFPKKNPKSGGTIYIWTLGAHKSAHAIAREFGHEGIVALLMERSPDDLKLAVACELGDEALFRQLVTLHPDLAVQLSPGLAAKLAHAARNNDSKAVRLMLEAGWPVDARGQHDGTPLHWAAFHGNLEMTHLLLRKNPPLELEDADFHATPLGWAIHGSEHGWHAATGNYAGVVDALLRAGAKAPKEPAGTPEVKTVLQRAR